MHAEFLKVWIASSGALFCWFNVYVYSTYLGIRRYVLCQPLRNWVHTLLAITAVARSKKGTIPEKQQPKSLPESDNNINN